MTPKGTIINGYKATDKDMECRGFQFKLGKWHTHKGDISLCESGFHFCEYPSGPFSYYDEGRLFKCEAEFVEISQGPGADLKHVCKRIRLTDEIIPVGHENTGDRNTGRRNSGDYNFGNRNVGDYNLGNRNVGDYNLGNLNVGSYNTGYQNVGSENTGNRNVGDYNFGNRNVGNDNNGDENTGNGNVGNYHSGDLCFGGDAPYFLFNLPANRAAAPKDLIRKLTHKLAKDEEFDVTEYLKIPNATPDLIKALHQEHIAARKIKRG